MQILQYFLYNSDNIDLFATNNYYFLLQFAADCAHYDCLLCFCKRYISIYLATLEFTF